MASCSAAWWKSTLDIPIIHAGQKEVGHRHAEQVGWCTWCRPLAPWIWLPAGGISRPVGGSAARLGVGTWDARAGCWSLTIGFGTLAHAHAEPCCCCTRRCQQPARLRLTGCSTRPSAPHAGWRTTRAAAAGRRRGSAPGESSDPLRTQIPPHVRVLGGAVARLATWQHQAGPQVRTVSRPSSNLTRLPFTHFYFTISLALQLGLALTLRAEYAS